MSDREATRGGGLRGVVLAGMKRKVGHKVERNLGGERAVATIHRKFVTKFLAAAALLAIALMSPALAAPARAPTPDMRTCARSSPDAAIAACSRIIASGRLKGG